MSFVRFLEVLCFGWGLFFLFWGVLFLFVCLFVFCLFVFSFSSVRISCRTFDIIDLAISVCVTSHIKMIAYNDI